MLVKPLKTLSNYARKPELRWLLDLALHVICLPHYDAAQPGARQTQLGTPQACKAATILESNLESQNATWPDDGVW